MTSTVIIAVALVTLAIVIFALRRIRHAHSGRPVDLGVVSTRWISELRRDEPWTRS